MAPKLDWYLHRRNSTFCSRSEARQQAESIEILEQVDARQQYFNADQAEMYAQALALQGSDS
jgi:hypothetical protein